MREINGYGEKIDTSLELQNLKSTHRNEVNKMLLRGT